MKIYHHKIIVSAAIMYAVVLGSLGCVTDNEDGSSWNSTPFAFRNMNDPKSYPPANRLTKKAKKEVLDTAKMQSDVYTNTEILKLEEKFATQILEIKLRLKKLEAEKDSTEDKEK